MANNLTPEKALIFRIVHVDNLPWLLRNGLPCRNADQQHPGYRTIGNPDLIERRRHREIPIAPGGTLADYVPFYFTPHSPMLYNIKTGFGGIQRCENREIAVLVSSLPRLDEVGAPYVVADRHAYLKVAQFSAGRAGLDLLPWSDWQRRHFKRDPEDPDRFERYQAEALVRGTVPVSALLGVVVYTEQVKGDVERIAADAELQIAVHALPGWYF